VQPELSRALQLRYIGMTTDFLPALLLLNPATICVADRLTGVPAGTLHWGSIEVRKQFFVDPPGEIFLNISPFYGGRRSQAARLYLVFVLFHAKKSYLKGRVHCVSVTVNPSTNLLYGVFTPSPIAIRATEPV
jgi:hypothetical protein